MHSPTASISRPSRRAASPPATSMESIEPMPRGLTASPLSSAGISDQRLQEKRQQRRDAVQDEPVDSAVISVPVAKLRLRSTCSCTIGSRERSSRIRKLTNAAIESSAVQRIHTAPNQSDSWPLSSTSCSEPSHNANSAKPR